MNGEMIRWVILLVAAPLWIPFARALWLELNETLADEGGLTGRYKSPDGATGSARRALTRGMPSVPRQLRGQHPSADRRGF